ncbi:MAG TPA: hypothetical protein VHL53_21770, partial [Acidimicrobiia bacterium]|nr:hypothetical protein [Acidimicrobiia bacterium]
MNTTVPRAGAAFTVKDPLPCLTNFANQKYSSNPPGAPYCSDPAYIPTLVTPGGFTPAASDVVTVIHADGTTATVGYTAGTGWVIPTAAPVAELDFPAFASEGANTTNMTLTLQGYAAPGTAPTSLLPGTATLLDNTVTTQPFEAGTDTVIYSAHTATAGLMVVSPTEPSGTVLRPVLSSGYAGNCKETVQFSTPGAPFPNSIEIAAVPSQAIYLDYLAPEGATGLTDQNVTYTLQQVHSGGYWYQEGVLAGGDKKVVGPVAPQVTANYGGTGRTLYQWVIPAGTITRPGDYAIQQSGLTVTLPPGCAGVYQNDMTVGYGAPVTGCLYGFYTSVSSALPPKNPTADGDLVANAAPLPGNYCGISAPLT